MNEADNSIIFSSPIQSAVVKMDAETQEIDWILSPPEGGTVSLVNSNITCSRQLETISNGNGGNIQPGYCRTRMATHRPSICCSSITASPEVIIKKQALLPLENYSRAVIYRINEQDRTVEQIWEYGKELGSYSVFHFPGWRGGIEADPKILILPSVECCARMVFR